MNVSHWQIEDAIVLVDQIDRIASAMTACLESTRGLDPHMAPHLADDVSYALGEMCRQIEHATRALGVVAMRRPDAVGCVKCHSAPDGTAFETDKE